MFQEAVTTAALQGLGWRGGGDVGSDGSHDSEGDSGAEGVHELLAQNPKLAKLAYRLTARSRGGKQTAKKKAFERVNVVNMRGLGRLGKKRGKRAASTSTASTSTASRSGTPLGRRLRPLARPSLLSSPSSVSIGSARSTATAR